MENGESEGNEKSGLTCGRLVFSFNLEMEHPSAHHQFNYENCVSNIRYKCKWVGHTKPATYPLIYVTLSH